MPSQRTWQSVAVVVVGSAAARGQFLPERSSSKSAIWVLDLDTDGTADPREGGRRTVVRAALKTFEAPFGVARVG